MNGINPHYQAALEESRHIHYYFAFVDWDIIDMIIDQTNTYATHILLEVETICNKC